MENTGYIVAEGKSEAHEMETAATVRSDLRFYMLLASVSLSLNVLQGS